MEPYTMTPDQSANQQRRLPYSPLIAPSPNMRPFNLAEAVSADPRRSSIFSPHTPPSPSPFRGGYQAYEPFPSSSFTPGMSSQYPTVPLRPREMMERLTGGVKLNSFDQKLISAAVLARGGDLRGSNEPMGTTLVPAAKVQQEHGTSRLPPSGTARKAPLKAVRVSYTNQVSVGELQGSNSKPKPARERNRKQLEYTSFPWNPI